MLLVACSRPLPEEECYEGGAEFQGLYLCNEPAGFWDEHPDSPQRMYYCEPADSADECELCPAEDIDEILQDQIREKESSPAFEGRPGCDGEFTNFARACGGFVEDTGGFISGSGCCYGAWYDTECNYDQTL